MAQNRRASKGSIYSVLDQYPLSSEPVDQAALQQADVRAMNAKESVVSAANFAEEIRVCSVVAALSGGRDQYMANVLKDTALEKQAKAIEASQVHRFNEVTHRIKAHTGTGKRIIDLGEKHAVYDDGTRPGERRVNSSASRHASKAATSNNQINVGQPRKVTQAAPLPRASVCDRRASLQDRGSAGQASRKTSRTNSYVAAGSASSETPFPPVGTINHSGMSGKKKREPPHLRKLFSPFKRARGGERQAA